MRASCRAKLLLTSCRQIRGSFLTYAGRKRQPSRGTIGQGQGSFTSSRPTGPVLTRPLFPDRVRDQSCFPAWVPSPCGGLPLLFGGSREQAFLLSQAFKATNRH